MILKLTELPNYLQFVNTQPLYIAVSADGSVTQDFINLKTLEGEFQSQEATALDPEVTEQGPGTTQTIDVSGLGSGGTGATGIYS